MFRNNQRVCGNLFDLLDAGRRVIGTGTLILLSSELNRNVNGISI